MSEDNLMLGPDAQVNHALALLRGLTAEGAVVSGTPLVPGIWFDLDPEGRAEGRYRSRPGELISARLDVGVPGRWLALHLDLGTTRLDTEAVLGFVCRSSASQTITARACLRTGSADGFTDRFFGKRIVSFDRPSTHLDALPLGGDEGSAKDETWRQLVLFFEVRSFDLTLQDLRVFLV